MYILYYTVYIIYTCNFYSETTKEFFVPEDLSQCSSPHKCSWKESLEVCEKFGDGLANPNFPGSKNHRLPMSKHMQENKDNRYMYYYKVCITLTLLVSGLSLPSVEYLKIQ